MSQPGRTVGASSGRLGLAALCLVATTTLVPFLWALSMSLKTEDM